MKDRLRLIGRKIKGLLIPGSEEYDPITRYLLLLVLAGLIIAAVSFWIYNRTHLFDEYDIKSSAQEQDVEGTQYAMLSGRVIKYSHDGIFCVDTDNETLWSTAYTMQTPICDICQNTMVIAEQQGTQVYVVNSKGVIGSFKTSLPILKAKVSAGGVVALVLKDSDVTWVHLYDKDGAQIVSVKTTVSVSGYPLDIALTPNARRMMISYLGEEEGELTGRIAFYDFSQASAADETHLVGSISYPDTVFPDVYYADAQTPVAIADDGFAVFSVGRKVEEKVRVSLDEEIISVFYDKNNVGFVLPSYRVDTRYTIAAYGYNGKRAMEADFNYEYTGIRMEDGEILLYDASNLHIFRTTGKPKLSVAYGKEVEFFTSLRGLRRYLVISENSMDKIRLK